MTFTFPFMLPIRSAQPDSIGISRATGFPCFVMTMPSGSRLIEQRKALLLKLRRVEQFHAPIVSANIIDWSIILTVLAQLPHATEPDEAAPKRHDDEKPPHAEHIANGIRMGQTEVTQAPCRRVTGQDPSGFKGVNLPVENVSIRCRLASNPSRNLLAESRHR